VLSTGLPGLLNLLFGLIHVDAGVEIRIRVRFYSQQIYSRFLVKKTNSATNLGGLEWTLSFLERSDESEESDWSAQAENITLVIYRCFFRQV